MKHYNLKIQTLLPFMQNGERLVNGIVSYVDRTGNGTNYPMQCDYTEITSMLMNRRYFDSLVWLQVSFLVIDSAGSTVRRTWRFVESAAGSHYWLDTDNGKWYKQDDYTDWIA